MHADVTTHPSIHPCARIACPACVPIAFPSRRVRALAQHRISPPSSAPRNPRHTPTSDRDRDQRWQLATMFSHAAPRRPGPSDLPTGGLLLAAAAYLLDGRPVKHNTNYAMYFAILMKPSYDPNIQ